MEKQKGWGADYPADWPRREVGIRGVHRRRPAQPQGQRQQQGVLHRRHLPHAQQDFVISLAKLNNTFPGSQTLAKGLKGDVNIASFAFMPAKVTPPPGNR